jgi:tetratricopeptide (TPR) repeat protein
MESEMKAPHSALDRIGQRPIILFILIAILTVAAYSSTLHSPTVLDDTSAFLSSSRLFLPEISFDSLAGLTKTRFGINRFIPVLSFALNHYTSEGRLLDYHLTNIAIHLLTLLFFYLFLGKLLALHSSGSRQDHVLKHLPTSIFIALTAGLWALNPVQTNAVTYLVQRMTSLCALFYVASLFFYLSGRLENRAVRRILYFSLAGVGALGAFLSKENSATLPLAALMLENFFISPGCLGNFLKKIKPAHWALVALFTLLALPIVEAFLRSMLGGFHARPFTAWERLLTESRVVVWYISLLFYPLPSRLNLDHDFALSTGLTAPWGTAISILLLLALFISAIGYAKRHPLYSFGILWFLINLIIESTIIPLEIVFEHRLYLPSMGLFMAASCVAAVFIKSITSFTANHEQKTIWLMLTVILLSTSSVLTTLRNNTWFDEFTIYEDCYRKSPEKPRTIANMGLAYAKSGDNIKARAYLHEAIAKGTEYEEEYVSSASNILTSLLDEGKYQEAMEKGEFFHGNIPPRANLIGLPTFLYTLGLAYRKNEKFDLALEAFKEALKVRRDIYRELYIYNALASVLTEIERNDSDGSPVKPADLTSEEKIKVSEQIFYIAIESRDYNTARTTLNFIEQEAPGKFQQLAPVLVSVLAKNSKAANDSDLKNHLIYRTDTAYRVLIKSIKFINSYYFPLKFASYRMLDHLRVSYPDDPFVAELFIATHYKDFLSSAKDPGLIDELYEQHDDFPPLIALAAKFYAATGQAGKGIMAINRLSSVYPANPRWFYWEQLKYKIEND